MLHWGVEEYNYPTPERRTMTRTFISAGADLLLGHHLHVVQGIERIKGGLTCYSLGNFIFDEIPWTFVDEEGKLQHAHVGLNRENRKDGMVRVVCHDHGLGAFEFPPTLIGNDGKVSLEQTKERTMRFKQLCSRLNYRYYNFLWKLYSIKTESFLWVKPLLQGKLGWQKLKKGRFRHLRQLGTAMRRSSRIVNGNSTNPFE